MTTLKSVMVRMSSNMDAQGHNTPRAMRRFRLVGPIARTLLFVLVLASCADRQPTRYIVLATTTSVGNSGLLDALSPAFQREHRLQVRAHLVGSGLALKMLEQGDADVVISHAPAAEAVALRDHPTWHYRKFMFNDFIIVGPSDDPARVNGARDAADAMRRIAGSKARFLSRGDQSGTHEREEALWRAAAARPAGERLVVAGVGMGATLRIASEMSAYTLTDRASFAQLADTVQLVVLFENDPELLNTYAVIVERAGVRASDAELFSEWLNEGTGRHLIASYRARGVHVFQVWPEGRSADRPDALPQSREAKQNDP
jgi:tungstate transport system substrate-binding protein